MIPVSRPFLSRDELEAIAQVFESRWLGLGSMVKEFEEKICEYIQAPRFLATNTGTSAIHLALRAFNIGKGDEVVVPSFTFVASVQAITAAGASPVFCDINPLNLNMDVDLVEALITEKTKAILSVHYRGLACDMDKLLALADKYKLLIIEDAAHAFGSSYKGRKIGSFGMATCFSFDPIKNITCGEGGGIVFQDEKYHIIAEKMRILGIENDTWSRYQNKRAWDYDVQSEGYRYHMPNFCAAIGLQQLKKARKMRTKKTVICQKYDSAFADLKTIHIVQSDYENTFPFMYVVLAEKREEFMAYLKAKGIETGIHYPPAHNFSYYSNCRQDNLINTEKIARMNVTLPLFYEMSEDEVKQVIDAVVNYDSE